MPDQLKSDASGGDAGDRRFLPRPITMEEAVGRQIDRIAYLRSVGQPWAEAVFMLRDLVVGLEDDEFWDGVPEGVRSGLEGKSSEERQTVVDRWKPEGWRGVPVRAYRGPGGATVYRPSGENLSNLLRIVMRLLARRGVAWRTRRRSDLGPRFNQGVLDDDAQKNGSGPED